MQIGTNLRANLSTLCLPIAVATLWCSFASAQPISGNFISAQRVIVGGIISQAIAADLNRDGKSDFLVVSYTAGQANLYVLLNNGNGAFTQSQPTPINNGYSVAVADVNRDGVPDVIYGDVSQSDRLDVAFGKGDGTFSAPHSYTVGVPFRNGEAVLAADFNGDGKPDIAVTNFGNDTVTTLLNNGNGTFRAGQTYTVGKSPISLAAADFNGDGKSDLIVSSEGNSTQTGDVRLLFGSASGVLQPGPITTFFNPSAVAIGDIDHDGRLDIAVGYASDINHPDLHSVSVMFGTPNGAFQTKLLLNNLPFVNVLSLLDLNHDGKLDLAIASGAFGAFQQDAPGFFDLSRLSVYPGNGDGTFQAPRTYNIDSDPVSLIAADINGDGRLDLVTGNANSGTLSILKGDGAGFFAAAPITLSPHSQGIVTADFNHDGNPDIAVVNTPTCKAPCSGTVSVFLGSGHDWFQPATKYAIGMHGSAIALGDVNGDGIADLVVTNNTPGDPNDLSVLLGKADGTFQPAQNYILGKLSSEAFLVDVNHDNKLDLVTLGGVALGTGHGTFGPLLPFTALGSSTVRHIAIGDFNHDGFPDVAVADHVQGSAQFTDELSVLLGNGTGAFRSVQTHDLGTQVTSMAVGKMNADNFPDLVLSYGGPNQRNQGEVAVILGKGDGTFPISNDNLAGDITYQLASTGWSVAIADLNNDGVNDIAVTSGSLASSSISNDFVYFPGNGDGTMGTPAVFTALSGNLSRIAIEDFNKDGRKDVVITNDLGISRLISH